MRGAAALAAAFLLCACGGGKEPAPATARSLTLDAQGVVFAGGDGSFDRFPFGSPRAEIERVTEAIYGTAAARRSTSNTCLAGPMAFTAYGPIQLNFRRERLVGWTMRHGAAAAAEGGIAPGITAAQLRRLTGLRMVADATLPGEFAYRTPAGEIRGVLVGEGPGAKVEVLFAGAACVGA